MKKAATVLPDDAYHPSPRQGATQIGVEEVTNRFKKYSPYVFSAHFSGRPDHEIIGKVEHYRIKLNAFENMFSRKSSYVAKTAAIIKKLDLPIVHVRNRPLYMPLLRKMLGKNYKLVLHEHNQNIADTLSEAQAIEVFESIDAYVAVSRFTYDFEITNKYPQYKNKAQAILNGVNLDKFRPIWEQKEKAISLRKKYNIANSLNILFAGAIRERKGIHHLVEAIKMIVPSHKNVKLVIAGGSKDNLEAKDSFANMVKAEAAKIADSIKFIGFIPPSEVQNAYLLGDIFVGPSLWDEPFGLVFAEASASGLAVIGSRKGGIPEIIKDGETGLLINDPEDPKEIADKIESLITNPAKISSFGRAARKYMESKFSWDRVAKEIEDLYDKL